MNDDGKTVQIRFVRRVEDIAGALWAECFPAPLEGRFWYHTLETCGLDDQFAFHYAVIERDGRPVGVAPCFLHDVPIALVAPAPVAWVLRQLSSVFPRAGCQRTLFAGSPCADEGTIGLVPGTNLADVIGGLRAAIRAKARELGASMIVFKDFPEANLPVLTTSARAGEFVATVSFPGTVVALPASGKDAYYRSLTHNQRHNLLKKLRRSRELLPLETSVVAHPTDRELAEIFGLFMQTYDRGRTKFERLGLRFFEQIREQKQASFILQRDQASGELVTFMLVLCLGSRVVNKFIGLNYPRGGSTFLYFRLFDAALDFAYARGATGLQSGQTGYRAKLDLGHRLVPLYNVFHHEQPLVHAAFRTIGRRVTWRSLDSDLAACLGTIRPQRKQPVGLRPPC
jgi:hypothetical protein